MHVATASSQGQYNELPLSVIHEPVAMEDIAVVERSQAVNADLPSLRKEKKEFHLRPLLQQTPPTSDPSWTYFSKPIPLQAPSPYRPFVPIQAPPSYPLRELLLGHLYHVLLHPVAIHVEVHLLRGQLLQNEHQQLIVVTSVGQVVGKGLWRWHSMR